MEMKQKLAAEPAIEGIPNRSRIAPFNSLATADKVCLGSVSQSSHDDRRDFPHENSNLPWRQS